MNKCKSHAYDVAVQGSAPTPRPYAPPPPPPPCPLNSPLWSPEQASALLTFFETSLVLGYSPECR